MLLRNERGELTEFTIGNLVLEVGGERPIPPHEAGLLAGTLRQEGLDVWRINSLRGWERVELNL